MGVSESQHARLIRLDDKQTKDDEVRTLPLPSVLVGILKEIEPKTGRVFSGRICAKIWMKACAACELGSIIEVEGKPYDPRY
jgi:hypothetical protein